MIDGLIVTSQLHEIDTRLNSKFEELESRLGETESTITAIPTRATKIQSLEDKVAKLNDDIATLKGITQVQDMMIQEHKAKIVDHTARSMANNVTISGLTGDSLEEKNCKEKVMQFLRNSMKMKVEDHEVVVAHRLGVTLGVKPRLMVVRCMFALRERIFKFTQNLKNVTSNGDYYYVKPQLPEPLLSEKNEREEKVRAIKKANKNCYLQKNRTRKWMSLLRTRPYLLTRNLRGNILPLQQYKTFLMCLRRRKKIWKELTSLAPKLSVTKKAILKPMLPKSTRLSVSLSLTIHFAS